MSWGHHEGMKKRKGKPQTSEQIRYLNIAQIHYGKTAQNTLEVSLIMHGTHKGGKGTSDHHG